MENRIKEWRENAGLTQQQLADKIGIHVTNMNRLENDKADLGSRRAAEIASILGVEPYELFAPPKGRMVPLVGYVGAGSQAHFYGDGQGPFEDVRAPEGSTDLTVAVEVRGESLGSLFDRWLVFYDDVRRPVTQDLIGRLCVVGLADDKVLVKKLRQSRDGKLFHLFSEREDPILDVVVEWAARVKHMAPRD